MGPRIAERAFLQELRRCGVGAEESFGLTNSPQAEGDCLGAVVLNKGGEKVEARHRGPADPPTRHRMALTTKTDLAQLLVGPWLRNCVG